MATTSSNPTAQRLTPRLAELLHGVITGPGTTISKRRQGKQIIIDIFTEAYLSNGGTLPSGELDRAIEEGYVAYLKLLKKYEDSEWTPGQIYERLVGIWGFAVSRLAYVGLYIDPDRQDAYYTWRLGATNEHCRDCAWANGRTFTIREWSAMGLMPQSNNLECGGYYCDCSLEPATIGEIVFELI